MEVEFLKDYGSVKVYWPDSEKLNKQLMEEALQEEKRDPDGMRATNYGGWHSQWVVQDWQTEAAKTLLARFEAAKEQMAKYTPAPENELKLTSVWVNINRDGHFNYAHWHESHWSGFYCVSDGGAEGLYNGSTGLVRHLNRLPWKVDTRPDDIGDVQEYLHPATEGSLLIFPGKLLHYVNPYRGDGMRITIAFNFIEEV